MNDLSVYNSRIFWDTEEEYQKKIIEQNQKYKNNNSEDQQKMEYERLQKEDIEEYKLILEDRKKHKELRKMYTIAYKKKYGRTYPFNHVELEMISLLYLRNNTGIELSIILNKLKNDVCFYHNTLLGTYTFSIQKRNMWMVLYSKNDEIDIKFVSRIHT